MVEGTAMKTECYPISLLPGLSRLFLDFAERRDALDSVLPGECLFHRVDDHSARFFLPLAVRLFVIYWSSKTAVSALPMRFLRTSPGCGAAPVQWSPVSR